MLSNFQYDGFSWLSQKRAHYPTLRCCQASTVVLKHFPEIGSTKMPTKVTLFFELSFRPRQGLSSRCAIKRDLGDSHDTT